MPTLTILRADASAIPFVMATERSENFDRFVGRWDEAQHRAALADGRHVYFLGRDGGAPVGFVIVRDWGSPERVALIKRMAVARAGAGARPRAAHAGGRCRLQGNERLARMARRVSRKPARAPRLRGGGVQGRRHRARQRVLLRRPSRRIGDGRVAPGMGGAAVAPVRSIYYYHKYYNRSEKGFFKIIWAFLVDNGQLHTYHSE
jgi:hypothetical protein